MFEKEAEEYGLQQALWCTSESGDLKDAFIEGSEYGYNEAKEEAKDIINELLINGYDESTREKALNFLYPDKEE